MKNIKTNLFICLCFGAVFFLSLNNGFATNLKSMIQKSSADNYYFILYQHVQKSWDYQKHSINKNIYATVLVKIYKDGTLKEFKFEEESIDMDFNKSVSNAIIKSNPFPAYTLKNNQKEIEFGLKFTPQMKQN